MKGNYIPGCISSQILKSTGNSTTENEEAFLFVNWREGKSPAVHEFAQNIC